MNINRMLRQDAVYWSAPTPDGYGGYTFADAIAIKCRWEDRQELFSREPGKEELSRAIVYTNRDLQMNGMLLLGALADLDSDGVNPYEIDGAMEIRQVQKSPDIKARQFLRKNIL